MGKKNKNKLYLLIAIVTVVLSCFELFQIYQQNNHFKNQNRLIEAERRSSLLLLLNNIFDTIDDELKKDDIDNELSQPLIARIISISYSLIPYNRLLDNGEFDKYKFSPEKGLLLSTLVNSEISDKSMRKIFKKADFTYSDFSNQNLKFAKLDSIDLSNSNFCRTNLEMAYLRGSFLHDCIFHETILFDTKLQSAEINSTFIDCNMREANLTQTNFLRSHFYGCHLDQAIFKSSYLNQIKADSISIKHSDFIHADFINKVDSRKNKLLGDPIKSSIIPRTNGQIDLKVKNSPKFNFDLNNIIIQENSSIIQLNYILDNFKIRELDSTTFILLQR